MTSVVSSSAKVEGEITWPFPQSRRVGNTVYIGLQSATDLDMLSSRQIHEQTHHVFKSLVKELEKHGASMQQLAKLHTYYRYEGVGPQVTEFWESMTAVRLEYLADPGPAATALRTKGVWPGEAIIGIDGIAELDRSWQRIMPQHAWDWSIPTPFSQGWLVGDKVYVGGQISADRTGRAVAPGEVGPQTINTMAYIESVLRDANADWSQVATIKVAYKHDGDEAAAERTLKTILGELNNYFPVHRPALVAFGVDLLYEGLLLEIDAVALKSKESVPLRPLGHQTWADSSVNFTPGWKIGNEVYIGGISAPGAASLVAQTEASMSRIDELLAAADAEYADLVKLNVYVAPDNAAPAHEQVRRVASVLDNFLAPGKTVVSIVQVAGLPWPGQRVQIDGIAVLSP